MVVLDILMKVVRLFNGTARFFRSSLTIEGAGEKAL